MNRGMQIVWEILALLVDESVNKMKKLTQRVESVNRVEVAGCLCRDVQNIPWQLEDCSLSMESAS